MSFKEFISHKFKQYSQLPFLTIDDNTYSYENFFNRVNKLSADLKNTIDGNLIVVSCEDPFNFILSYLSVLACNRIPILVHPIRLASTIDFFEDIGASALLTDHLFTRGKVSIFKSNHECLGIYICCLYPKHKFSFPSCETILLTSGSSGSLKAVMLSYNNIVKNFSSIMSFFELKQQDVIQVIKDISHSSTLSELWMSISQGLHIITYLGFNPSKICNSAANWHPKFVCGVPQQYELLIKKPIFSQAYKNLSYLLVVGGASSQSLINFFSNTIPNTTIGVGYGQTEASPRISMNLGEDLHIRPNSVGRPIQSVSIWIEDENHQCLRNGQIGEIVIKGENVMLGYVRYEYEQQQIIYIQTNDNILCTGDIGYLDDENYLYVIGRRDRRLKINGYNVYPEISEKCLMENKSVEKAISLGVFDQNNNTVLCALVELKEEVSVLNLLEWCDEKLISYEKPSKIYIVEKIPTLVNGKIDKLSSQELLRLIRK